MNQSNSELEILRKELEINKQEIEKTKLILEYVKTQRSKIFEEIASLQSKINLSKRCIRYLEKEIENRLLEEKKGE